MRLSFAMMLLISAVAHGQEVPEYLTSPEEITDKFLEIISGDQGEERDWDTFRELHLPTAQLYFLNPTAPPAAQSKAFNLEEFVRIIGPSYARDGFEEISIGLTINEFNGIANVFQSFHARNLTGTYEKRGINSYQLVQLQNRWWIASTTFINEVEGNEIPDEYLFPEFRN